VSFCELTLLFIQEINGLLTCEHRPKVEPEQVALIHRKLFDLEV
jgi:hypothetical protein